MKQQSRPSSYPLNNLVKLLVHVHWFFQARLLAWRRCYICFFSRSTCYYESRPVTTYVGLLMTFIVVVNSPFTGKIIGMDQKTGDISKDVKPFENFTLALCFML